jgi:EpsI family protein
VNLAAPSWSRFALALGLIVITAGFLAARSGAENVPAREPLAKMPLVVDGWNGRDREIDQDALRVLGDGEFLLRDFSRSPAEPWINLFVAYFPTQRTGSTMHSPQNCLPGAGWLPIQSGLLRLRGADGEPVEVNRYIIAKGLDRQLVLYWYQSHGRIVASEYWAKIFLVTDAMRWNRSDGAMVRVITPITRGESEPLAVARATSFAERVFPTLEKFIPR